MEFSVCYEFAVQRRIPWDEDVDALRRHVNDVRSYLEESDAIEQVRTTSNASKGHLTLEFVALGTNRQTVDPQVRALLGDAIRSAGAYHRGLFPVSEEIKLRPRLNQWSGLRTPTWRVKRSATRLRRAVSIASAGD